MRAGFWAAMAVVALGVSGCVYVPPTHYGSGYYAPAAVAPGPVYMAPRPYYYRPYYNHYQGY